MKTKGFPHQIKSLIFHLQHPASGNFSEQGTGKTWIALATLEQRILRKEVKKALIICPASIIHVWENEIEKHADHLEPVILHGPDRVAKLDSKGNCFVVSYDSLLPEIVEWALRNCQMVIIDEVHKVKNIKAKRTKLVLPLTKLPYRLVMSGTPFPNNLTDIFTIAYLVDRGETFGKSYYDFLRKYFFKIPITATKRGIIYKYIPRPPLLGLAQYFVKKYGIRFLRSEIEGMPQKIYQVIPVPLTKEQKEYLNALTDKLPTDQFKFELPPNILAKYEKLQQITAGFIYEKGIPIEIGTNKHKALLDILPNLTYGDKKTIVVVKYRYEIEKLERLLASYNPLVLSGDTPNKEQVCQAFQENPSHKVLIMQISCGIGVTLTAADSMVFLTNSFSYADRYQSEDRICRTGQKQKRVLYIDILALDSLDQKIIDILNSKRKMLDDTLGVSS